MNGYEFMGSFWLPILLAVYIIAHYGFLCWNRLMRHLNIRRAGWPPTHLDADGDFKPEPKPEAAE